MSEYDGPESIQNIIWEGILKTGSKDLKAAMQKYYEGMDNL